MAMPAEPLVAVLIPAHKAHGLDRALRSAVAQRWPCLEIVVSDDSPDDTVERIVSRWLHDPRVRYRRHPAPAGAAANYRRLLDLTGATWGLYLDDDDELLDADAVARLVAATAIDPAVTLVRAHYEAVDHATGGRRVVHAGDGPPVESGEKFLLGFTRAPAFTGAVLFSVAVARSADIFGLSIKSADWESWLRIALHGKVAAVPQVLARHVVHEAGLSQRRDVEMDLANLQFIDRAAEHASRVGTLPAAVLRRWRWRTRRWYMVWTLSGYLAERRSSCAWRAWRAVLRDDPGLAVALACHPPLVGSVILAPLPALHRSARAAWRRLRFGRRGQPEL